MGRKSIAKDHLSPLRKINQTTNNTNDLYRKRLRSWKQAPAQLKANPTTNDTIVPSHRSTIYTYPIHRNQSIPSSAILSESLTTESAFYCPSISCTSIQTTGDVNNNHVPTLNVEDRKRKTDSSSCESFSSQASQIKTQEVLTNANDRKNISTERSSTNHPHLTYQQNPAKRSRLSTDDSIITNHYSSNSAIYLDGDTIDINQSDQQEPLLSSANNESLINNSTSMEAAVKMVQPIVEIIFNAFEDQLKHVQIQSTPPPLSNTSFIAPMVMPYFPLPSPARPIVLHAVNFNIQLTAKQSNSNTQHLSNIKLAQNVDVQLTSLTDLKERVASYVLSSSFLNDHHGRRHNFKRIVQLAVVGVSVLCGYWLL